MSKKKAAARIYIFSEHGQTVQTVITGDPDQVWRKYRTLIGGRYTSIQVEPRHIDALARICGGRKFKKPHILFAEDGACRKLLQNPYFPGIVGPVIVIEGSDYV